jgi:hypothetical protein
LKTEFNGKNIFEKYKTSRLVLHQEQDFSFQFSELGGLAIIHT